MNVYSHELWLEPRDFNYSDNKTLEIDIKIGQKFDGARFGFLKKEKKQLFLENKNTIKDLEQRNGSFPALQITNIKNFFSIINYETNYEYLKYESIEKFLNFLDEYGLSYILDDNKLENTPSENYKRFAKTLIFNDEKSFFVQKPKMDLELVANNFPKKNELSKFKLFYKKVPLNNWPIIIFSKDANQTYIKKIETNSNGEFEINLIEDRIYLISAVKIYKSDIFEKLTLKSDFISLWASLTFKVN